MRLNNNENMKPLWPFFTKKCFFKLFFFLLWLDRIAEEVTGNRRERGSDTQQRAPGCSEDKASVDGTPALPTELNGAPPKKAIKQECRTLQEVILEEDIWMLSVTPRNTSVYITCCYQSHHIYLYHHLSIFILPLLTIVVSSYFIIFSCKSTFICPNSISICA